MHLYSFVKYTKQFQFTIIGRTQHQSVQINQFKMLIRLFSPLILLLGLTGIANAAFENCNFEQVIEVGKSYYIFNPRYSNVYTPGTTCRWIAKSDRRINMTCSIFEVPESPQCAVDVVIIQSSNAPAGRYCGNTPFTIISEGNQITTELYSSTMSRGGRFLCTVQTVATVTEEECKCGWKNPTRIVGGVNTGVNEFPMMAGLVDITKKIIFCGATIINPKQVITAAHCVMNIDYRIVGVIVGEHDITTGNETNATRLFRASSIVIHVRYSSDTQDNDIAIVNVNGTIEFNELVGPVCLPVQHSQDSFAGNYVDILGWGSKGFGEKPSAILQKVRVHIITNRECSRYYPTITTRQTCTVEENKDACQFDSGGPVLWTNPSTRRVVLVSTVSFGSICADGSPAVNCRVGAFIDWILLQTPPGFKYCEVE